MLSAAQTNFHRLVEKRQSRAQQQAAQDVREPVYAAEEPADHDGRHQNQAGEFRQRPQGALFTRWRICAMAAPSKATASMV